MISIHLRSSGSPGLSHSLNHTIHHHIYPHHSSVRQAAATLNEAFRTRSSVDKHYVCVVNGDLFAAGINVRNKARVDVDIGLSGVSSLSPLSISSSSPSSSTPPTTLRHLIQKTTAERVKVFDYPTIATTTVQKKPRHDLVEAILSYQPIHAFAPPGTTTATSTGNSNCKQRQTLVKIALETGRKHQIRAQMAHIGHPIVGDVKYGASQG